MGVAMSDSFNALSEEGAVTAPDSLSGALRSRHADTLQGRLAALDDGLMAHVEIVLSATSALTAAGQHLAVYVANLLGRLEGVVSSISVVGACEVRLRAGVDPRVPQGGGRLDDAVRRAASLAAPRRAVEVTPDGIRVVRVAVGRTFGDDQNTGRCEVYAAASDWTAFVGRRDGPDCEGAGLSAAGAHVAASFAAAEVFRLLRARERGADGPDAFTFSAWDWRVVKALADGDARAAAGGANAVTALPPFTLAGAGAVGSATLLTLWATRVSAAEATVVDGDFVSATNLNRYPLFGVDDLGARKAARVADLLARDGSQPFRVLPIECWWGEYQRSTGAVPISLLLSAVDTNVARHQLQDALPGIILGASTHGLRAELGRYNLGDARSRCLKCFNAPEASESDVLMQRRLLGLDAGQLTREAEDRGVPLENLIAYVNDLRSGGTGCAFLTGPQIEKLRHTSGEGGFAVSFVSSLAGALLAAQLLREAAGAPLLTPSASRAIFQLWNPTSEDNATFAAPVDPECWCRQADVRAVHRELHSRRR
jgi:hypothetical protein